ncbi:SusC/RagA family TonB-linked outer membrane protein [Flavobacterium subsaxonicum]|uniref:TonB-dependent receptor n=1 Tax=Flavobacterium subsaxonicum WB 4.1-42 = DSM 21790 TaxID=1121898 RepID=A0A0A2MNP1_9FLAO|nr:TonB-dependent receptor [Flavobacterium subsaxonicum]KGO94287.1 TonB-dependent receptor [Flavobacterium subsaxonicum WB 4.1-42 = DSM 21790]
MGNKLHSLTQWCTRGKALFYLLFLCCTSALQAQNTVTGVVSDDKGMTIPGVNVTVKGATTAVSTNLDGEYSIEAPADATLVFSFIGFTTQEIAVKGRKQINTKLTETAQTLDEVVVIGYGTQKKDDVNSAVSSIRTKDIENLKQTTVDQMIQGKASGVSVSNNSGQPGSAVSIRVRGTTSISGTNEPLYIIDGVPVSGDATGKSMSGRPLAADEFGTGGGAGNNAVSPLSMINPNDIQSIDILKDASATAIYGSRGANGVIIITTKSGKKGTGKISYEGYTSAATIYKKLDVLNLREYAAQQNALTKAYGLSDDTLRPEFANPELLGEGTDWQDEVYRTAIAKSHQLSFSGGSETTSYYVSGGFLDQQGTLLGSGYKRYTMRLNLDTKVKDWLRIGVNTNTGITNEKLTINQSFGGLIANTLLQSPDIPVRNPDGSYAGPLDNSMNATYFNPVAEALSKDNKLVRKNFLGNVYAEAQIIKGLKYRIELGANTEFSENTDFTPSYAWGVQTNPTADLIERRQNWYSTNIKNLLTYDAKFGKHAFTILAGQEANDSHWEGISATATGFASNDVHTLNLADPSQTKTTGYKGSASIYSVFARVIYDFDSRYGVSASIRSDRSSKFYPGDKSAQTGSFPSVTGSWKLSNESFMENTRKYIDNIKFRVGYGETGNQQIANNQYSAQLAQYTSQLGTGYLASNISNPAVTWESMQQTNFGIDFTLLDSRLSASFDVYSKKSKDFLFQVPLPAYLTGPAGYGGMDAPTSNLGSMQNRGYDITLNYNTKGTEFVWNSTLVFSHYKNELLSIQDELVLTQAINLNGYISYDATNTVVGQPIGMFYGYVAEGLFTSTDQLNSAPLQFGQSVGTGAGQTYLGDVKYRDVNGDNVIDASDRTLMGNPHPDFTFGFTNNFKYKNFDLSVFTQGSYGNDVLNLTYRAGTANAGLYQNALSDATNYWTPENSNTNIPRPVGSTSAPNNFISTRYIEDGSYLRIQNVTLGYSLPADIISKVKLTRVRIYGSVQNLHTFTKYKGYDPEIGSFNQNQLLTGIDNGRYPTPRTFSVGVNVEF